MLLFLTIVAQTRAQLTVTPNANATFLVNQLIGPGISVTNATLIAPGSSSGTFNGTASNIGLPGGVLLTSGDATNAIGPNMSTGISTGNNAPGDAQLNTLSSPFLTEDACILEFDMVATCDTIQISYVFGSDEYDEWVCTSFTDVFAFFISGPGIVGSQNIAVIPGTSTPISINTVNIGVVGANAFPPYPTNCNTGNSTYYTTNNVGTTVEYDGFTVPLIAKSAVIPCSTYHIKLAIADAGDDALDSGVFLEQGGIRCASTFYSVEPQVNSPGVNFAVEGCVSGGFTFHRDGDSTQALTMYYSVGGTATPGLDYPTLPGSVSFPANSSTVFLPINATSDGLNEPTETILIILTDTVCGITESDTAVLEIGDQLIVNAGPDQTICEGTTAVLGDTALAFVTYSWSPSTNLNNPNISDPGVTPNAPGSYTYSVLGMDTNQCQGTDTMTLTVIAMPDAQFTAPANVCLGGSTTITYTGTAPQNANYAWNFGSGTVVSGSGQGPYTVQWNTAGQVYVTLQVTDNQCVSRLDSMPVNVTTPPSVALTGVNSPCFGQPQAAVSSNITNGVPGFLYAWSNGSTTPNLNGVLAGSYSVTVTDQIGCTGTGSVTVTQVPALTNQLTFVPILCNGGTGSITANPGGGSGNYTYLWSNGQTTQTILPTAGTYTVTVTDANSGISPCTISNSITMNEPPAMNLQISPTVANCGQNSGTANAIPSGGVQPYSYAWSNGGTTPFIQGLGPGPISVTVTDANGCTAVQSSNIVQTPVPTVNAGPDASFCEGEGGVMITATGTGGTLPYYYTWTCANPPCGLDSLYDDDPNANPTSSQYFYIQITDGNGCTSNIDSLFVTVLPKPLVNAGPDIYLCGDSAPCHILTPTITNATGPYTYNWSPSIGLNNSTIANPCARPDTTTIYALVVTAGNGCTSDFTTTDTVSTVVVNVNPIPIADAGPDLHICLGDSVQIAALGYGAGPSYDYQWSPTTGLDNSTLQSPMTSPPITTTYTLVVTSNHCPSYGDQVVVNVHTIPTVDAGWDREICLGESIQIDASASGDSTASYTFQWSPGTGFQGPTTDEDPIVSPVSTTTYVVEAISTYGCGNSFDSMTVFLKATPVSEAGNNIFICKGDSAVLQGSYSFTTTPSAPANEVFYNWTPNAAISSTTILQPTVWPTSSTIYYLDIRYRDCHTTDSVFVSVGPEVIAAASADTSVICASDSVQLHSTGSLGNDYLWSPAGTLTDPTSHDPVADPKVTTTYTLVVGSAGCFDTTSVTVEVLPQPNPQFEHSLTSGCAPHTLVLSQTSSDAIAYVWNFGDGGPVSNLPEVAHLYAAPGTYPVSLTVIGTGGCENTSEPILVHVSEVGTADFISNPSFPATLPLPSTLVQFTERTVHATSWHWDFGDGFQSSETNPSHTFSTPGTYFVTLQIQTGDGCMAEVSHGPYIITTPDLFIPNVFSPNGDGVNDVFTMQYTGDQPVTFQVFDRWGIQLFSSKNKTEGWDGKNPDGVDVTEGVYYYLFKAGDREFTGSVTLVR